MLMRVTLVYGATRILSISLVFDSIFQIIINILLILNAAIIPEIDVRAVD